MSASVHRSLEAIDSASGTGARVAGATARLGDALVAFRDAARAELEGLRRRQALQDALRLLIECAASLQRAAFGECNGARLAQLEATHEGVAALSSLLAQVPCQGAQREGRA